MLIGTRFDIEHVSMEDGGAPYWHVQDLGLAELRLHAARGLAPGLGLELSGAARTAVSRIEYEDLARRPYAPANPDLHHRNETVTGLTDMTLLLHAARPGTPWTVAGRVGVSLPIGRTEDNPFELGRLAISHQHFQFGTGTWDPILGVIVGRSIGETNFVIHGLARFVAYENARDYRAGHRFSAGIEAGHPLGGSWLGRAGIGVGREEAEEWDGRRETEGNLGRTDLALLLGLGRTAGALGSLGLSARFPVYTRVSGDQVDQPVVLALEWGR